MRVLVKVRDGLQPGQSLLVENRSATLRDLLLARIKAEVEAYNTDLPEVFAGLVQPEESERLLNGYRMSQRRPLDVEQQYRRACDSFARAVRV